MHQVLERIGQLRLIPMVVIDKAEHADPFGDALVAGGLPVAEVTFRTDAAEAAIRAWRSGVTCSWGPVPC